MKTITYLLTLTFLLWTFAAQGADIPYSFETLVHGFISMNSRGETAATAGAQGEKGAYIDAKGRQTVFDCGGDGFVLPAKINDKGAIGGGCSTDLNSVGMGFIRERSGAMTFIVVPGADSTSVEGLNNRGQAVGGYMNPYDPNRSALYRFHGFLWDGQTIHTVDVPIENSVTTLLGIDDAGRALGVYRIFDPYTNENLGPLVSFIYDNGQFTQLSFPGAYETWVGDINALGQMIGDGHGAPGSIGKTFFFYDDGNFYTLTPPTDYRIANELQNIDDNGRIFGFYFHVPTQTEHPFLATQAMPSRGKGRGKNLVDVRH